MELEFVNRANTNCYKWDSDCAKGKLPLWVADMDFKAAPPIIAAMQRRLNHGVFGYNTVPQEYYDAVASWFSRRHGWNGITADKVIPTIGVVPAIAVILKAMTKPGDKVLTFTPAYNCFYACIHNMECQLVESVLLEKPSEKGGVLTDFSIDWDDFEQKVAQSKMFILCNPHNPTGRVWTRQELSRIAEICEWNNVFVLADEIHCEITFPGHSYTPYAIVAKSSNYCVCTAASKAFNIAGLQCSNIFVPDSDIHQKIEHAVETHEVGGLNPFGIVALIAAYNECEDWMDALNAYVYDNWLYLRDFIGKNLPMLRLSDIEGTYLAWIDMSAVLHTSRFRNANSFCQLLADKENVLFNPSEMYGCADHIRINLATSREILTEALDRMCRFINQ